MNTCSAPQLVRPENLISTSMKKWAIDRLLLR